MDLSSKADSILRDKIIDPIENGHVAVFAPPRYMLFDLPGDKFGLRAAVLALRHPDLGSLRVLRPEFFSLRAG